MLEDWKVHMGPEGAAKEWLNNRIVVPPPAWMTPEEVETHIRILKKGGRRRLDSLKRNKTFIRGIDEPFYSKLTTHESKDLDIPALVVTAEYMTTCVMQLSKHKLQRNT
ncbi:hypothetical protein TSTA_093220 [Talaromyces stipitatus ATCC 10500]|uniref:Uncharacterized protein n=1 Tax=Talaromyces stipitatus (strain ATCC 10500 / CBS 375.48 / QM 6759 / NRRL 1006) TaxID=441959 RepID=B8LZJ4_TALSN|nr:uncharacterized protein TSTA_093220 [Talaromyces stipitatus ATCC 10500]EED22076.1 hypothetical protein TSTA_093220 [Talaromyces stipitatus ATCC 10500]